MLNKSVGVPQENHSYIHHEIEAIDVGEISDLYKTHADSQAVHDIYELGNEVAAEKNDPQFDNRVGFTNCDDLKGEVTQSPAGNRVDPALDLNNPIPHPPAGAKARFQDMATESRKLDSSERTNDSTIDPNKPRRDILKGFHGG
jgi:hypothetical protein